MQKTTATNLRNKINKIGVNNASTQKYFLSI